MSYALWLAGISLVFVVLERVLPRYRSQRLLRRGILSDALYVVISDELVVELPSGEKRTIGAGGVVGERAALSPGPSDITVTAPRGAVVLQLTAAKLTKLASMRPALGKHLTSLRIESNASVLDAATVS